MAKPQVWRSDQDGRLYHETCFEELESREGFTLVKSLDELEMDDDCASCDGVFLEGLNPEDFDDTDEEDE